MNECNISSKKVVFALLAAIVLSGVLTAKAAPHDFVFLHSTMTSPGTFGGTYSAAFAVSADGSVIVGDSNITGDTETHAFKYFGSAITDLGTLGGTVSHAYAVSADGSVIVGGSNITGNAATHAFKYFGSVMTDLGTLGGTYSGASAVSADGSVIVGESNITGDAERHAFKYSGSVMTDLGTLGGTYSAASAVSADGSVIVGYSNITGDDATHAFIYRHRMIDVDNTISALAVNARQLDSLMNLKTAMLAGGLAADCAKFGPGGFCMAADAGNYSGNGDDAARSAAAVRFAYRVNSNLRAGILLDRAYANANPGNFSAGGGAPLLGAFAVLNFRVSGAGAQLRLSAAYDTTEMTITRSALSGTEAGRGKTEFTGSGYMAKFNYGIKLGSSWTARPFAGLRHTVVKREGYAERSGAELPAAYKDLAYKQTTALLGLNAGGAVSKAVSLGFSGGLERNIGVKMDGYAGTLSVMGPFRLEAPEITGTRAFAAVNAAYKLTGSSNLSVGANVFRQPLKKETGLMVSVAYTIGL